MNALIIDDHAMFRWGVRQYLTSLADIGQIWEAGDGRDALVFLETHAVDMILLDLEMPENDGADFLRELNKRCKKKPKVIILSQTANETFCRRLYAEGINGYILKTEGISEIANALSAMRQGQTYFSPGIARIFWDLIHNRQTEFAETVSTREREVAKLVSEGLSTQSISDTLGCAPSTIKTHRSNLMRKIGAKNSADVARWFMSDRQRSSS